MRYSWEKLQAIGRNEWTMADYVDLTRGGRFYFLRPRSIRARIRYWRRKR